MEHSAKVKASHFSIVIEACPNGDLNLAAEENKLIDLMNLSFGTSVGVFSSFVDNPCFKKKMKEMSSTNGLY